MKLTGKTALVTGGVRRVGRAIADALEAEGARVLVTSRSPSSDIQADLTTRDGVERLLAQLPDVDVLINSAANFIKEPFDAVTWENFDETFALNVRAPFFLSQAIGMRMRERGWGRIVNIADIAAIVPFPAYLPYSMSKSAIVGLTRGLAKALAPAVLVNAVAPGPVLPPDEFTEEQMREAVAPTLLKRTGSAEDVARAVVFLATNDYITGVTLPVDGGRLLR
ncbi:MAG TPA: SDR family oxidoreductase [Thermoanaerobaculia bacterium]|nr:SDR family oxidoreductase [Thermoanaerobaculia bacterium]